MSEKMVGASLKASDKLGSVIVGGSENSGRSVALYGVQRPRLEPIVEAPIEGPRGVVALYGVRPSPIKPEYPGNPGTGGGYDINISVSEIKSNITVLKSAVNTIKSNWEGVTKTNVAKLNNSWAGDDCAAYIEKVNEMDKQVNTSVDALNLLINTYQKALDQLTESQSKIASSIKNMN